MELQKMKWHAQQEITWEIGGNKSSRYEIYNDKGEFVHLATCDNRKKSAFIVRACNSYDDLLSSLKNVLDAFDITECDCGTGECVICEALKVIAKAEATT